MGRWPFAVMYVGGEKGTRLKISSQRLGFKLGSEETNMMQPVKPGII